MKSQIKQMPEAVFENNLIEGWIVSLAENGQPCVDFCGNSQGPISARSIVSEIPEHEASLISRPVLLAFVDGEPIVLGLIRNQLLERDLEKSKPAVQKELILEAGQQVSIRCGQSSVTLTADGKIMIKGAKITSRASEANKIKGAVVLVN